MIQANSQHDLLPNGLYVDPLELVTHVARELDKTHWNTDTLERISRRLRGKARHEVDNKQFVCKRALARAESPSLTTPRMWR